MHRPETWGYVQFSAAPVGTVQFRPDRTREARSVLHAVYYAQRDYRSKQGTWARSLESLGLAGVQASTLAGEPQLETTRDLFEVSVELKETRERWHIGQDARIWRD